MDFNSLFSALSLFAVLIYLYIGFYTFNQNKKSIIHKFFLLLCICYAIWSFAYAFAYVSTDKYVFSMWNKISAIGWCSFSAISLYLVLLITENRFVKNKFVTTLIFLPMVAFFYMALFLFGPDIDTSPLITNIFYTGDFLYNFSFLLISIIVIFQWGLKSKSLRVKTQSKILVLSSIIPFSLNLLTQTILPIFGYNSVPLMGQLYSVIMIIGTYIVITRYKFLRLPERFLVEEVGTKMMEMVILTNENHEILKVSKYTEELLGFKQDELLNMKVNDLLAESYRNIIDINNLEPQEGKYKDVKILNKYGETIPININYIPVFGNKIPDFLGAILVMQDIRPEYELRIKNQELHEKTIRDSLTNLYNHQHSMEIIKNEIDKQKLFGGIRALSLMMIDIDHFKRVNDSHGHVFGDYVLEKISTILVNNTASSDYVGRFGGEEFIILLPDADVNKALDIGERIRKSIEAYKFDNDLMLTVSIGIKQFNDESPVQLVKNADDLLYKAKEMGRNKIEYCS